MSEFSSSIMVGRVSHRRFTPQSHQLDYPLFMACINLDEIDQLTKSVWGFGYRWWHWARFKRSDYVGGTGSIKSAVQKKVFDLTGERLEGRVEMVCHLRYLGLYFSPVNFYYLYDGNDNWQYLLAEVSNTPWNERHYYAIKSDAGLDEQNWRHQKAFHVSPFNPVNQRYHWKLKPLTERLMVHLECHKPSDNDSMNSKMNKVFDATLKMRAQPMTSKNLLWQLIKMPVLTVKVVIGIYWHAFKLWKKGVPLYTHPDKQKPITK
jgi:DUF1365 family protein